MQMNYNDLREWINNGCDITVAETVTELKINHNDLTILPIEISYLTNLRIFDCSYNNLTTLPSVIGNLTNLLMFDCNDNQLTILPQ